MYSKEEVTKLLQRHKKLLLQELTESKDMVFLLRKSISTDLSDKEKSQVKEQLADVFKAIPAFSIFLLPGGAILLPILLKIIPTLLPSSYREEE